MICPIQPINNILKLLFKGQKVTYCCFNLEAYAQHTLFFSQIFRSYPCSQRAAHPSWRYQICWKDASVHHLMDGKWLDTLWPVMLPNTLILFHRSVWGAWWNIYVRVSVCVMWRLYTKAVWVCELKGGQRLKARERKFIVHSWYSGVSKLHTHTHTHTHMHTHPSTCEWLNICGTGAVHLSVARGVWTPASSPPLLALPPPPSGHPAALIHPEKPCAAPHLLIEVRWELLSQCLGGEAQQRKSHYGATNHGGSCISNSCVKLKPCSGQSRGGRRIMKGEH